MTRHLWCARYSSHFHRVDFVEEEEVTSAETCLLMYDTYKTVYLNIAGYMHVHAVGSLTVVKSLENQLSK